MVAPDQRGLVSKAAAVLALNSLGVHSASVNVHEGVAITEFVVSPHFGSPPAAQLLRQQFVGALAGDVDVLAVVEKRDIEATSSASARAGEVVVGVPVTRSTAPPRILWLDTATEGQSILEVRAMDRPGLLAAAGPGARARGRRHRLGKGQYVWIDCGRRVLCGAAGRGIGRRRGGVRA